MEAGRRGLGSYTDILAEFPESARSHFPPDAKELAAQIANEIKIIESVSGGGEGTESARLRPGSLKLTRQEGFTSAI